jgi:hypothetical protein
VCSKGKSKLSLTWVFKLGQLRQKTYFRSQYQNRTSLIDFTRLNLFF